jgi:hypothetical protein
MSRGFIVPIIQKQKKWEKVGSFRKNNAMTFVANFLTNEKQISKIILCINHSNAFKDCKYKNVNM